jgi:GNAT superfamily N-acetyltransferase
VDASVVTIRRATVDDAVAIARVRVESWRTTYRGMIPKTYLDGMSVESSAALWTKVLTAAPATISVFVAEDADGVLGFASGNRLAAPKLGFDSELSAIYLRPEFQRNGIGRRLYDAVAGAQRGHGANGMIVWVIAANKGARAFYEALGARLLVEQAFEWDGLDLVEAGYGWHWNAGHGVEAASAG